MSWSLEQALTASDATLGAQFGVSVALAGERLAVGASGSGFYPAPGAAYVFELSAGTWVEQQKLTHGVDAYDFFGWSIDLAGDTLVVGQPGSWFFPPWIGYVGSVRVYTLDAGTWTEGPIVWESQQAGHGAFGHSVDLCVDLLAVGAPAWISPVMPAATHLFSREGGGWIEEHCLVDPDRGSGQFLGFGASVACEGRRLTIGDGNRSQVFVHFLGDALGQRLCDPAETNSTGQPGRLNAHGSDEVAENHLLFVADQLPPHELAFLATGPGQGGTVALGGATGMGLCIAVPYRLFHTVTGVTDAQDTLTFPVDLNAFPGPSGPEPVQPGQTWCLQSLYRDGLRLRVTDALRVRFL